MTTATTTAAPMTPAEFKRIRESAGLTQTELGERIRVSDRRTIRRWEKGEREISGPVSLLMELLDQGRLS